MADFVDYRDHIDRTGLAVVQLRTLDGNVVTRDVDGATPEPDAGPLAEGVIRSVVGEMRLDWLRLGVPETGQAATWDFGAKDRENGPAPDNITGPSPLQTLARLSLPDLDRVLREPVLYGELFPVTSPLNDDVPRGIFTVPEKFDHATQAQTVLPVVFPVATGRRDANGDIIDPAGLTFHAFGDDGSKDGPPDPAPDYPAGSKLVDPGAVESG